MTQKKSKSKSSRAPNKADRPKAEQESARARSVKSNQPDEAPVMSGEEKKAVHEIREMIKEFASHIRLVEWGPSTMDRIDALRKKIIEVSAKYGLYPLPAETRDLTKREIYDLLKTTLKQILPYYQSFPQKGKQPEPEITAANLREAAEKLGRLVDEQIGTSDNIETQHITQNRIETETESTWQAKAISYLYDHRDWSIEKIAKKVHKSRSALYADKSVHAAIIARNSGKRQSGSLPSGEKNPETGHLQAWHS